MPSRKPSKMLKKRRLKKFSPRDMPDHLVYGVCCRILQQGEDASVVAAWVRSEGYECNRRQAYDLVDEATQRGMLSLSGRRPV